MIEIKKTKKRSIGLDNCGHIEGLSPILYDTLVHLDLMLYRELRTPEALKAALKGVEQVIIDATERAYRRSQDDVKQREYYSGKKKITC